MESIALEKLYESMNNNPGPDIIGRYIAKAHGNLASCLTSLQQVEEQLKQMNNSEVLQQAIRQYASDISAVQDNISTHFARYFHN